MTNNRFSPHIWQQQVWSALEQVLRDKATSGRNLKPEKLWKSFSHSLNFHHFIKFKFQGIYIWGSVGSGKTAIMDHFYSHLSPSTASRVHFAQFMQDIHRNSTLGSSLLGYKYANKRILCLDEFQVRNIADAMTLRKVLQECKERQTFIVSTSNTKPSELYSKGIRRENFLPCIEHIKKHFQIIHLTSEIDLRLENLPRAKEVFSSPIPKSEHTLDFGEFFAKSLWTSQYLKLLNTLPQMIHIANFIPFSRCADKNIIERFITFIDCAYEAKHTLKIDSIYSFEECFPIADSQLTNDHQAEKRCISRCIEMLK